MPLGVKPVCSSCTSSTASMWSKSEKGKFFCNECVSKQTLVGAKEPNGNCVTIPKKGQTSAENAHERVLRKSSRNKPSKYRVSSAKPVAPKGKGRRIIFKKSQPVKAPMSAVSTVIAGESIFYDGIYYQVGDIVSLVDDDENIYYAQIRGFLQDQYYQKSTVITWLLPTKQSSRNHFDASTYVLGPEEDLPRKMECMEFVCHAPSDYFKCNTAHYPSINNSPKLCYVWSSLGPEIKVAPTKLDEMFGSLHLINVETTQQTPLPKKTKIEKVKIKEENKFIVVE